MGFFDAIGNVIGFNKNTMGSTSQSAPEIDPRLKQIRDAQIKQATDYRTNMKSMKDEQYNQAAEGSRQDLASRLAGVTSNMNNRGLLFSGLNQKARADTTQGVASDLAQTRANLNNRIDDQANALDSQALGTSFAAQQAQQGLNDSTYQSNLARAQLRQTAVNNLFQAPAKVWGSIMGQT